MVNVDFSRASLRDVSFRKLTLDKVRFPQDAKHVVINGFASSLEQMIEALKQPGDVISKKLVAFLLFHLKWAVPDQVQGVINLEDLVEVVGGEGKERFLAVIPH